MSEAPNVQVEEAAGHVLLRFLKRNASHRLAIAVHRRWSHALRDWGGSARVAWADLHADQGRKHRLAIFHLPRSWANTEQAREAREQEWEDALGQMRRVVLDGRRRGLFPVVGLDANAEVGQRDPEREDERSEEERRVCGPWGAGQPGQRGRKLISECVFLVFSLLITFLNAPWGDRITWLPQGLGYPRQIDFLAVPQRERDGYSAFTCFSANIGSDHRAVLARWCRLDLAGARSTGRGSGKTGGGRSLRDWKPSSLESFRQKAKASMDTPPEDVPSFATTLVRIARSEAKTGPRPSRGPPEILHCIALRRRASDEAERRRWMDVIWRMRRNLRKQRLRKEVAAVVEDYRKGGWGKRTRGRPAGELGRREREAKKVTRDFFRELWGEEQGCGAGLPDWAKSTQEKDLGSGREAGTGEGRGEEEAVAEDEISRSVRPAHPGNDESQESRERLSVLLTASSRPPVIAPEPEGEQRQPSQDAGDPWHSLGPGDIGCVDPECPDTPPGEEQPQDEPWWADRLARGVPTITPAIVTQAIALTSKGRATGLDGLPSEVLRALPAVARSWLAEEFTRRLGNSECSSWGEVVVRLLPKIRGAKTVTDYRPISLINLLEK
eukprot:160823-Alexandrium_andersonii.AAC.1